MRNPFRFDPDADYGWNLCEGTHDNPARSGSVNCSAAPYTPPAHEYGHVETGCEAVISGAFVPDGFWPASYDDRYLFGDFVCNKILQLTPKSGGGFTMSEFATGVPAPGPIEMVFGPHGSGQALLLNQRLHGVGAQRSPGPSCWLLRCLPQPPRDQ